MGISAVEQLKDIIILFQKNPVIKRGHQLCGLESRPCPMYLLGTCVRDASRLVDPRNPPRHQGVVHPLVNGHPHRFSTDFEQTLLGGHLTQRDVGCPRSHESLWVRDHFRSGRCSNPCSLSSSGLSDAPWLNRRRPGSFYSTPSPPPPPLGHDFGLWTTKA